MRLRATAILAFALAAALPVGSAFAVEKGDTAPSFRATDFDGRAVDFPAVAGGKPAVVVFWATWCPYCKAFMPYLKNIAADYASYGVKIVAIDAKEDGQGDPKAYVRALGFKPIAVTNGDKIADDYGIKYIPGVLIVDGKGVVAWRRPWSDLPAGREVAELWDKQVRTALNDLIKP
ncbi:MAG TPA: TlpA disulfide reductase family protein [Gammaproteobacteria bacterium]|nr:TlpA disulfide reductase family protein [Gammaproteobacteria bacterium]